MKRLALTIGILWFFHGCHGDKLMRTYRLINGTEKEVRIAIYDGEFLQPPIVRKRGSGSILEVLATSEKGSISLQYDGYYGADSAIVTFDMKRKIAYISNIRREVYDPDQGDTIINRFTNPLDRNIFLDEAYEVINNGLYEFTFTEEDYSNADSLTAEERKELDRLYETYRYKDPWWD
ncbi:MAG: hypothetical protein OXH57_05365 [Ekhidna sp.]|nr:hypothetical protein [Ekhidna sp.]